MSVSSQPFASLSISRSEFLSSLPRWRRWLATLNWHPTDDARISALASDRQALQLESEIKQIENESEQIEREGERIENESERIENQTEQVSKENAHLAVIESKLDAVLLNFDTSSPTQPATDSN